MAIEVDLKTVDKVLELASELGIEFECFEGTLLDSYLIYNDKKIYIKGQRKTKYIIIESVYLNCWSSKLVMTFTDSDKKANEFLERYSYNDEDETVA